MMHFSVLQTPNNNSMKVDKKQRPIQPYQKVWKRTLYTGSAVASAMTFDRFRLEDQQVHNMSHESSIWTAMMQDVTAHSYGKKRIVKRHPDPANSIQDNSKRIVEGACFSVPSHPLEDEEGNMRPDMSAARELSQSDIDRWWNSLNELYGDLSEFDTIVVSQNEAGGMGSRADIHVQDNGHQGDHAPLIKLPISRCLQAGDNVRDTESSRAKKRFAKVAEADSSNPSGRLHISLQGHQEHSSSHGGTVNPPTGECKSTRIDLSVAKEIKSPGASGNQPRNPVSMKPMEIIQCRIKTCKYIAKTYAGLRTHRRAKHTHPYRCYFCHTRFKNLAERSEHDDACFRRQLGRQTF